MACPTELSGRAPSDLKNRGKSLVRFWLIGFGLIGMRHSLFYPISAMKTSTKHSQRIRQIHRPASLGMIWMFSNFKLSVL